MLSRKRCRGTLQDYKKREISKRLSKLWTNRNVFSWCPLWMLPYNRLSNARTSKISLWRQNCVKETQSCLTVYATVVRWFCDREFKLKCRGVGVHPPLQLSHQVIHFRATALFDTSVASVFVINNHVDKQEFKHPVPRIGTGKFRKLIIVVALC